MSEHVEITRITGADFRVGDRIGGRRIEKIIRPGRVAFLGTRTEGVFTVGAQYVVQRPYTPNADEVMGWLEPSVTDAHSVDPIDARWLPAPEVPVDEVPIAVPTHKVRVSGAIRSFIEGGQLWATPDDMEAHGYGNAGRTLVMLIADAKIMKDSSVTVSITDAEIDVLRDHVDAMMAGAKDNAGSDRGALAELNSGRALLRKLDALGG